MDTLPTELHLCIVQELCYLPPSSSWLSTEFSSKALPTPSHDALYPPDLPGAPIRALARTSRYYNALAAPFLYHTAAVFGLDQAAMLLERLEERDGRTRGIRRLFVSDQGHPSAQLADTTTNPTTPKPTWLTPPQVHIFSRLLTLASPTLHTLSIHLSSLNAPSVLGRLFRLRHPSLTYLAATGFYPFPSTPGAFPNLKELRLSGNTKPSGLLGMCALEDAAPMLETLVVRGVGDGGVFLQEVRAALSARKQKEDSEDEQGEFGYDAEASLPPSIRRVTVQSGPPRVTAKALSESSPKCEWNTVAHPIQNRDIHIHAQDTVEIELIVLPRPKTALSVQDMWAEWTADISA